MGNPYVHPDDQLDFFVRQGRSVLAVNAGIPEVHINERLLSGGPLVEVQPSISPWSQPSPLLLQVLLSLPWHTILVVPVEKEGRILPLEALFVKGIKQVILIRVVARIGDYQDQRVLPGRYCRQFLKKPGH